MAVDKELLEILACPVCKTPVKEVRDGAGLECTECGRIYPVEDDIPVMLIEEAETPGGGGGADATE
jgi:uncharacterized protein YbaR (Trm112 family)